MGEKGEAKNGITITLQDTFIANKQPFSVFAKTLSQVTDQLMLKMTF